MLAVSSGLQSQTGTRWPQFPSTPRPMQAVEIGGVTWLDIEQAVVQPGGSALLFFFPGYVSLVPEKAICRVCLP